mmetsp:Transcript_130080/g.259473  ORF Transcript_130080/g.259473 Transcript_130080/m.259473 type:complete len:96 (-) Transcript_130080:11-298(-)
MVRNLPKFSCELMSNPTIRSRGVAMTNNRARVSNGEADKHFVVQCMKTCGKTMPGTDRRTCVATCPQSRRQVLEMLHSRLWQFFIVADIFPPARS